MCLFHLPGGPHWFDISLGHGISSAENVSGKNKAVFIKQNHLCEDQLGACTLTDKTLRFFASEIIREKILLNYDKEIPYSCEIAIESYKEEPTIDRISATIFVARNSQKGIIIGHKGEKLKKVGQAARHDLEAFLGKKVFLELYVKVQEDWRNNDNQLRRFGYELE